MNTDTRTQWLSGLSVFKNISYNDFTSCKHVRTSPEVHHRCERSITVRLCLHSGKSLSTSPLIWRFSIEPLSPFPLRCTHSTQCVNPWAQWSSCQTVPSASTAKEPLRSCWRSEWEGKGRERRSGRRRLGGISRFVLTNISSSVSLFCIPHLPPGAPSSWTPTENNTVSAHVTEMRWSNRWERNSDLMT